MKTIKDYVVRLKEKKNLKSCHMWEANKEHKTNALR